MQSEAACDMQAKQDGIWGGGGGGAGGTFAPEEHKLRGGEGLTLPLNSSGATQVRRVNGRFGNAPQPGNAAGDDWLGIRAVSVLVACTQARPLLMHGPALSARGHDRVQASAARTARGHSHAAPMPRAGSCRRERSARPPTCQGRSDRQQCANGLLTSTVGDWACSAAQAWTRWAPRMLQRAHGGLPPAPYQAAWCAARGPTDTTHAPVPAASAGATAGACDPPGTRLAGQGPRKTLRRRRSLRGARAC